MMNTTLEIIQQSSKYRLLIFISFLILFLSLQAVNPRVLLTQGRLKRWFNNLSLSLLNTLCLKWIFPALAVQVALSTYDTQQGLLHTLSDSAYANIAFTVLFLDFAIYLQHIITHKVPFLWRLHRVHHTDKDLDATSGSRFHTLEIIGSMFVKISLIKALGLHPIGVLIFEVLLSSSALFNHSNIYLPMWLDKYLQRLIVTPDMHRIHHSELQNETDSNYGFFLSVWDRTFKTHTKKPFEAQKDIVIGLKEFDAHESTELHKMLICPFRKK